MEFIERGSDLHKNHEKQDIIGSDGDRTNNNITIRLKLYDKSNGLTEINRTTSKAFQKDHSRYRHHKKYDIAEANYRNENKKESKIFIADKQDKYKCRNHDLKVKYSQTYGTGTDFEKYHNAFQNEMQYYVDDGNLKNHNDDLDKKYKDNYDQKYYKYDKHYRDKANQRKGQRNEDAISSTRSLSVLVSWNPSAPLPEQLNAPTDGDSGDRERKPLKKKRGNKPKVDDKLAKEIQTYFEELEMVQNLGIFRNRVCMTLKDKRFCIYPEKKSKKPKGSHESTEDEGIEDSKKKRKRQEKRGKNKEGEKRGKRDDDEEQATEKREIKKPSKKKSRRIDEIEFESENYDK